MSEFNLNKFKLDYVDLGKRLKAERKRQDFTQEKLAEVTGLTTNYIAHIECGSTKLSLTTLVSLCNALKITPDKVLLGSVTALEGQLKGELADILEDCDSKTMKLIIGIAKTVLELNKPSFPEE